MEGWIDVLWLSTKHPLILNILSRVAIDTWIVTKSLAMMRQQEQDVDDPYFFYYEKYQNHPHRPHGEVNEQITLVKCKIFF